MKRLYATLVVAAMLAGCAGTDEPEAAPEPEPPTETSEEPAPAEPCPVNGNERQVSDECIDPWPLTVESGTLRCDADSVTIEADGNRWAVNGMAGTRGDGDDIGPIWAEGDGAPKVDIGALIDAGLDLC